MSVLSTKELGQRRNSVGQEPIGIEREAIRRGLDDLFKPKLSFEEAMARPARRAEMKRINDALRSSMTPARLGMALVA